MIGRAILTCLCLACVFVPSLFAQDEVDELIEMDGGEGEQFIESVDEAVTRIAESGAGDDVQALVTAIRAKEVELQEARLEIERLKKALAGTREASVDEKVTLFYNMACVYRAVGEYDRAEKYFRKAVSLDPFDSGVHFNLAILYDDCLNNNKKARKHYEKFLELAPDDKDAASVVEWLSSLQ